MGSACALEQGGQGGGGSAGPGHGIQRQVISLLFQGPSSAHGVVLQPALKMVERQVGYLMGKHKL